MTTTMAMATKTRATAKMMAMTLAMAMTARMTTRRAAMTKARMAWNERCCVGMATGWREGYRPDDYDEGEKGDGAVDGDRDDGDDGHGCVDNGGRSGNLDGDGFYV